MFQKFFGIIRQSAGPNDHPTTPTFLHLYKILSIYSVLKPPKHGNCTVTNTDAPKISLADLHEIFHDKTSDRSTKINNLKSRLDTLIAEGIWEPCQVLPSMDSYDEHSSIRDCVVYYVCGYVTKQILKRKKCPKCIEYLKNGNIEHPAAKLISLKSRGNLVYPNTYLFEFLSKVESSFAKHCKNFDVFERVIDEVVESKFELKYTCAEHQLEVATDILVYFIQMRLRQYTYQENLKLKKISREKKKISKLYNT